MKFLTKHKLFSQFSQFNHKVWILGVGRFLSEIGTGFTLFYAPIVFVNQVGLSATAVGFALGSASISGVIGRILGGSICDSLFWGRRRTLLLSAAISAIASLILAATSNFSTLVVGNLLMGFAQGLYWTVIDVLVADLTNPEQNREAYALTRLADNLGLGMGIVFGGVLIGTTGAYQLLFVIDAISFVVFFAVVYFAIPETYRPQEKKSTLSVKGSWATALRDRRLLVYVIVNTIFTIYISQLHGNLPLYLKNFVSLGDSRKGFDEKTISVLLGWHLALAILCQLPIARALKRFTHTQALTISAGMWAVGFCLIWVTGVAPSHQLGWAILGLGMFALATVSYTPSASSLVTDLAPESRRGVYFSINSLCWAAGYSIGLPLGGWTLDRERSVAYGFWLGLALSVGITILILQYLNRVLHAK